MTKLERTYLRNAVNDLKLANLIMREYKINNDEMLLEHVSYSIQQCTEKYLKHLIEVNGGEVTRTHDITELLEHCDELNIPHGLEYIPSKSRILTRWNITTRYPIKHKNNIDVATYSLSELNRVVMDVVDNYSGIETIGMTNIFKL